MSKQNSENKESVSRIANTEVLHKQDNKTSKKNKSGWIDWLIQGVVLVLVFLAITWWQQRNMLPAEKEQSAPAFTLVNMQNNLIEFNPNQQTKKTLIYFFATWCGVCHASIDNIEAIKKSTGDSVNFYAIALDWKSKEEIQLFLEQHKLTVPVLMGTRSVWEDYKISGFPSYYVIDEQGKIAFKDMGYTTELGMRLRLLL
ncbi:MAG: TlpA family protein disulfide reductase [Kangiellaceae bacterium]